LGSAGTDRVIAPDADFVPDAELTAMAPEPVSVHARRVHLSSASQLNGDEPIELATLRAYVEHLLPPGRGRRRRVETASRTTNVRHSQW
jgi:hypothetical protein